MVPVPVPAPPLTVALVAPLKAMLKLWSGSSTVSLMMVTPTVCVVAVTVPLCGPNVSVVATAV